MTTEGNKSVLKTKLGLENLKGLGDTLKQIKELSGTINEAQQTLAELAKDNSPLGRALARLIEAQGLKTLNEDNINVSEEVRKKMEEELKEKDQSIEKLEAENKELTEDKVVREVTDSVTAELDRRLPKPGDGGDGSGGSKLFKALEDVVADYLQKRLLGTGGEGALTGDQIRSVVREEVGKVAGGNKKPEDMVDDLVNALTMGDKLRDRLGVAGIGGRLLQPGGDSGLRTDLVKVLLEDERERLRMTQDHEVEVARNKHIGTFVDTLKDNMGDGIAALKLAAEEIKGSSGAKTSKEEQPQVFECADCHTQFSPPPGWAGQNIKCPNPACGREYTKEEILAT